MLQDACKGIFKVVVIKSPRQLSKEPSEAMVIYRVLRDLDIKVLFYNGVDYSMGYWLRQYERMCKCLAS